MSNSNTQKEISPLDERRPLLARNYGPTLLPMAQPALLIEESERDHISKQESQFHDLQEIQLEESGEILGDKSIVEPFQSYSTSSPMQISSNQQENTDVNIGLGSFLRNRRGGRRGSTKDIMKAEDEEILVSSRTDYRKKWRRGKSKPKVRTSKLKEYQFYEKGHERPIQENADFEIKSFNKDKQEENILDTTFTRELRIGEELKNESTITRTEATEAATITTTSSAATTTIGEEKEQRSMIAEEEEFRCLVSKTALVLQFSYGMEKSNVHWVQQLLQRTIIGADGVELQLWMLKKSLPKEVADLNPQFRQVVGFATDLINDTGSTTTKTWTCHRLQLNETVRKDLFRSAKVHTIQSGMVVFSTMERDDLLTLVLLRKLLMTLKLKELNFFSILWVLHFWYCILIGCLYSGIGIAKEKQFPST